MNLMVEKGIPIPGRFMRDTIISALRAMSVGDSFFIDTKKQMSSVREAARQIGALIVTRSEGTGHRCWLMRCPPKTEGPKNVAI